MKTWLFLRGEWDKNNRENVKNDTDMWCQLFAEIAKEDNGLIWFKSKFKPKHQYYTHPISQIYSSTVKNLLTQINNIDYVFARGGHPEYEPILKAHKKAYTIYYGAGKRIIPNDKIKYNLILVDTEEQLKKAKKKFPKSKCSLWIKPAAKNFKPVDVKKKYDVCYVADCHSKFQEDIKRVKWVYKTVPKDLKVFHLGKSSLKPPKNVTVKRVSRLEMPKYYSQCKTMIVPYKGYDSEPRVIAEGLACNIYPLCFYSVNTVRWVTAYDKDTLWNNVKLAIKEKWNAKYENLVTLEQAANHIRGLIK